MVQLANRVLNVDIPDLFHDKTFDGSCAIDLYDDN